ncbi:MAG: hypothetical protein JWN56_1472 [Sphingobacteriales bacterium]|nr:hypothetical protein [Sphingobacteriales bacterium]
MIKAIKDYFSFSKKEFNGILILCFITLLVILFPLIYPYFQTEEKYDFKAFEKEIAAFEKSSKPLEYHYENNYADHSKDVIATNVKYFNFDPNDLPISDWQKLGLTDKQIKVIKNYESKGGKFYSKEDLKKIYSIKPPLYAKLEPFISINESSNKKGSLKSYSNQYKSNESKFVKRIPSIIELNTADSTSLDLLKGIGPAFATRILKYRDRLGGFNNINQLKEVYGIDSAKFLEIKYQVNVDGSLVRKINVNTTTFDELKKQPYLSYKQMNAIIQYRKQHGSYNSIADLKKIPILNEETLHKIEPYLIF